MSLRKVNIPFPVYHSETPLPCLLPTESPPWVRFYIRFCTIEPFPPPINQQNIISLKKAPPSRLASYNVNSTNPPPQIYHFQSMPAFSLYAIFIIWSWSADDLAPIFLPHQPRNNPINLPHIFIQRMMILVRGHSPEIHWLAIVVTGTPYCQLSKTCSD